MWKRVGLLCAFAAASAPAAAKPPASKLVVTQPIIEVLDPGGSVTVATVQLGLAKLTPELAKCGDDAKWTGDALVWLITDWHGKVVKAEVAVEKLAVEKCLAVALRGLVVPRANSRATTMMRLRIAPPPPPPVDPNDQLK